LPALKVNIISVHPSNILRVNIYDVHPLGWTIIMFTLTAGNNNKALGKTTPLGWTIMMFTLSAGNNNNHCLHLRWYYYCLHLRWTS
jgi:hypothetical protein